MNKCEPQEVRDQQWSENTRPVVTVVCITFNQRPYIREAIESFLSQKTTFPVEIVIHDDASVDGTAEVVRDYAAKFPQFIKAVLQPENIFSRGISRAPFIDPLIHGEFLAICEGDDYWHRSDKLEKQVAVFREEPSVAMVCSDVNVLKGANRLMKSIKNRIGVNPRQYSEGDITLRYLKGELLDYLCSTMLPTSIFYKAKENCDFKFWPCGELVDLQIQVECSRLGKIRYIPEALATYRILPVSAARPKTPDATFNHYLRCLQMNEYYIKRFGYSDEHLQDIRNGNVFFMLNQAVKRRAFHLRARLLALVNDKRVVTCDRLGAFALWSLESDLRFKLYCLCDPIISVWRKANGLTRRYAKRLFRSHGL